MPFILIKFKPLWVPAPALQKPWRSFQVNGSICSRLVLVLHFHRLRADRRCMRGRCGADSGMHTRVRGAVSGWGESTGKAGRLATQYMYIPGCSLNVILHIAEQKRRDAVRSGLICFEIKCIQLPALNKHTPTNKYVHTYWWYGWYCRAMAQPGSSLPPDLWPRCLPEECCSSKECSIRRADGEPVYCRYLN